MTRESPASVPPRAGFGAHQSSQIYSGSRESQLSRAGRLFAFARWVGPVFVMGERPGARPVTMRRLVITRSEALAVHFPRVRLRGMIRTVVFPPPRRFE